MSPPITIGLVQYNSGMRDFLPYSVGLLQATLEQHSQQPERYRFLLPRFSKGRLQADVEALIEADVVGLSMYVWNEQRCLALAQALKADKPEILIVIGGPQVPDRAEQYLLEHPEIDVCVHGEGEAVFLQLMENFPSRSWQDISGISYRKAGLFKHQPQAPKERELENFPSPFLTGVFDALMASEPDINWATIWETNRGCPFTCVFCDWGSATASRVNRFGTERLLAELDWFSSHGIDYIFCADANFGILPRDVEIARYAADLRQRTGLPVSLLVQNAKNVTERSFEIQCILAESGLDTQITISLQSLHPPTLEASGRKNISLKAFEDLHERLRARNIHTYTDLIIGLPEETYDSFADGLSTLIEKGQYFAMQLFAADILPNAPMADPAYRQRYALETVQIPSIVNHTPVIDDPDGIVEYQQTVIATSTMPREDWARTRTFAWMAELLFFKPGLLRIPFLLLNVAGQIPMCQLLEAFMQPDSRLNTLNWCLRFLLERARGIQRGESEFCPGVEPNGKMFWWSPCEALLDLLIRHNRLESFYREAAWLLNHLLPQPTLNQEQLNDSLFLSASFVRIHSREDVFPLRYQANWNIWDFYQGVLTAQAVELERTPMLYIKDWPGAPMRLKCLPMDTVSARHPQHQPGLHPGFRSDPRANRSRL